MKGKKIREVMDHYAPIKKDDSWVRFKKRDCILCNGSGVILEEDPPNLRLEDLDRNKKLEEIMVTLRERKCTICNGTGRLDREMKIMALII